MNLAGRVTGLLFLIVTVTTSVAQETRVPKWDARGSGPLPRQGVAALDVSSDGSQVVAGTIASAGEPNVVVLDRSLKLLKSYSMQRKSKPKIRVKPTVRCRNK